MTRKDLTAPLRAALRTYSGYLFGRAVIENLLALADRIAAHSEGFGDLGLPRPS